MLYQKLIEDNLHITKTILQDMQKEISYKILHEKTMNFVYQFRKRGIIQGDRVLIVNDNSIDCIISVLACVSMGAVFIMIPNTITEKQVEFIVKDSEPKLICQAQQSIQINKFPVQPLLFGYIDKEEVELENRNNIDENSICYILYTSGSTKNPKGVVACQKQVLFCVGAIQSVLKNTEKDNILNVLPLSFDFGLYQIFLALMFQSELVLLNKYIIPQIPGYLNKYKITIFPLVPSIATLLIKTGELEKHSLPYLRQINSTGDVLEISVIHKLKELFPKIQILPMYGLTECKRVSIIPENCLHKVFAGSCGRPLPGVSVYLINQDETGIGELIVEGENVMEGYWRCPEENDSFCYNLKTNKKILRTGDLFIIDEDGFLYYKGRIKNIIKSNGYRISNVELESELLDIHELIEVKVFGIPDEFIGEKICVAVYSKDLTIEEKIRNAYRTWQPHQRPHILIISCNPLPKNTNGKLDKFKLMKDENQSSDFNIINLR